MDRDQLNYVAALRAEREELEQERNALREQVRQLTKERDEARALYHTADSRCRHFDKCGLCGNWRAYHSGFENHAFVEANGSARGTT